MAKRILIFISLFALLTAAAAAANYPAPKPGDYVVRNWQFKSGESLDEVRLHYYTLGEPARDAGGRVTNAVLILHGTGGSGRGFLNDTFAGMLFAPGQLLDAGKYFIILPDNVGHGGSSKPSDGLRMRFPHYEYDDMVALQHELLGKGLNVNHLRLVLGTSMGCMHAWLWGEQYPDFVDALMPLACAPVEIAGRNRMMRKMLEDAIRDDPAWNGGNYGEEPREGVRAAEYILTLMSNSSLQLRKEAPTRDAADKLLEQRVNPAMARADANDMLYQFDSSRNYNPAPKLESIQAAVMAVNSADDLINPPELGLVEREIRRVKRGQFVLLPITDQTRGHGTHSLPAVWQHYLAQLLIDSGGLAPGTSSQAPPPIPLPFTQAPPQGNSYPGSRPAQVATLPDGTPVYRMGSGITPPRQIAGSPPPYTEYARKKKITGIVVLRVVVLADGTVQDVVVQRSLEHSLDQSSVDAIRNWRFQPAMKDGQPVAVQVNVETSFNLR